jgi:hypothetical protein
VLGRTRSLVCKMKEAYERSHRRRARSNPAFPARMALTASFALSLVSRACCHHRLQDHRLTSLISASGYQDHTTSPSAPQVRSSAHRKRPSHPAPNVRDDRDTPLLKRGGTLRKVPLIWGRAQLHRAATHWHDGQISRHDENLSSDEQLLRPSCRRHDRSSLRLPSRGAILVMPGLVPGIHVFCVPSRRVRRGWPGHRRAEATPFFERLCPAMMAEVSRQLLS